MIRDTPPRPVRQLNSAERAGQTAGSIINIVVKGRVQGLSPGTFSRSLGDVGSERPTRAPNGMSISPLQQSRGLEGEMALSVTTGAPKYDMVGDLAEVMSPHTANYASTLAPKPVRIMSPRVLNSDVWNLAASYEVKTHYSSDDTSSSTSNEPTSRDSEMGGVESMFSLYQNHDLEASDWLEGHEGSAIDEQVTPRRCSNPLHQALDSIRTE